MATIGIRFEDLCPSGTQPKRSLLQKLNESHGSFISSMRLSKSEKHTNRRQKYIEESRSRALSTSSSLTQVSVTPSDASASSVEKDNTKNGSRNSSVNDNLSLSPGDCNCRNNSDFSVPFQYANMPKDREQRRNIVNGMQSFMIWKQASYDSSLERPFHISPPQTSQSSHSWSSLCSAPSEMSDEQVEQWLERPVTADEHRSRKASGGSAASVAVSTTSTDASGPITTPNKVTDSPASEPVLSAPERGVPSPNTVAYCTPSMIASSIRRKPLPVPPAVNNPVPNPAMSDCSKPLPPLLNKPLPEITVQLHTTDAQPVD